jgi:hypothetical protein
LDGDHEQFVHVVLRGGVGGLAQARGLLLLQVSLVLPELLVELVSSEREGGSAGDRTGTRASVV